MILQPKSRFTHQDIMQFIGRVNKMKEERMHDIKSHYRMRIKHYLSNISEVLLDWTITRKIENP
ncbi:hypothetical protein HYS48_03240 [Candidatus Woesearchaeota archaeon]|nr:hypothetical protein [Candidatus Woesearchaeota archaeon]